MQEKERLQYKIDELKQRWHKLSENLAQLEHHYDAETRIEETLRLKSVIAEKQQKIEHVEQVWGQYETQLKQLTIDQQMRQSISDAQLASKNKAYPEALQLWKTVLSLSPNHPEAINAVAQLQQQIQQQQLSKLLITQLIERMQEIPTIFAEVVRALNTPNSSNEFELIVTQTQHFINHKQNADQYTTFCQSVLNAPVKARQTHDYAALSQRIKRGEMVLFMGSNLLYEYSKNSQKEDQLATVLAEKIGYPAFTGTLSSIAELYQLLPEHGRTSLLSELHKALPCANTEIPLYDSLAKIRLPLVLISSAYDDFLEQAFMRQGKPYVALSSIVVRSDEYDIGHVVVRYSDNKHPERSYIEEELSRLHLLKQGYSIIYKIRGTCTKDLQVTERDALTLAESNYFTFARYGKKIIPSYLSRQFRDRGFLFIGFSPNSWEERLLVNTVLKKRQYATEACYTIASTLNQQDKMATAYWNSCNVREYQANLYDLDRYLAEAVL